MIPIKCFTCGNVIADKYLYYQDKLKGKHRPKQYFSEEMNQLTEEGRLLNQMELTRMCCRRMMLTHVDI